MINGPKQTHFKLKSLKKEFKELKEEIENIHIQVKLTHGRGEDIRALISLAGEKLIRASHMIEELIRLVEYKAYSKQ